MTRLCLGEVLEVARDLAFLSVTDQVDLTSHRLGACVATLEKVQVRIMEHVLGQQNVLGAQEAQMQIRALRDQIATMEGGLAKIISGEKRWEDRYWEFRDKIQKELEGIYGAHDLEMLLGPARGEISQ